MSKKRSERYYLIYDYICKYWEEHSYAPTVKEISTTLDISSLSIVHRYLNQLVEDGLLMKPETMGKYLPTNINKSET